MIISSVIYARISSKKSHFNFWGQDLILDLACSPLMLSSEKKNCKLASLLLRKLKSTACDLEHIIHDILCWHSSFYIWITYQIAPNGMYTFFRCSNTPAWYQASTSASTEVWPSSTNFESICKTIISGRSIWKYHLQNSGHFVKVWNI